MISMPGNYKARVLCTWVNWPDGGSPYVKIKATVTDGAEEETQMIFVYISDKALPYADKQLKVLGFDIGKESVLKLSNGSTLLEGREFDAYAAEETYNGKTRLKWKISTDDAPISEDAAKKLDEKLRAAREKSAEKKEKPAKKSDAQKLAEIQAAAPKESKPMPGPTDKESPLF